MEPSSIPFTMDPSTLGADKAQQQGCQRAFSPAAGSHQGNVLPLADFPGYVF